MKKECFLIMLSILSIILSSCNSGNQKLTYSDSLAIYENFNKGYFAARPSTQPIPPQQAIEWITNYAHRPLNQISYNQDPMNIVKLKSFELDSSLIKLIWNNPEIKGLRCYFAKRSSDTTKRDYTIIVIPMDNMYRNIKLNDTLHWALDWHKPNPPSSDASFDADTLGGPIQ